MANHHEERAAKIIAAFKESISAEARSQITDAEYEQLSLMIQETIAEELSDAAEMIDQVAKRLRHGIDKLEIEL